ncbi:hypothetical protein CSB95_4114 [Pseudomonas aeruginosa]|nr:hypothetical protein CSC29_1670 [Pseudomonas aeruginosa]PRW10008.1 hypothetical protein CSB95_4114 [Pseudomonas aeruginosa]
MRQSGSDEVCENADHVDQLSPDNARTGINGGFDVLRQRFKHINLTIA